VAASGSPGRSTGVSFCILRGHSHVFKCPFVLRVLFESRRLLRVTEQDAAVGGCLGLNGLRRVEATRVRDHLLSLRVPRSLPGFDAPRARGLLTILRGVRSLLVVGKLGIDSRCFKVMLILNNSAALILVQHLLAVERGVEVNTWVALRGTTSHI